MKKRGREKKWYRGKKNLNEKSLHVHLKDTPLQMVNRWICEQYHNTDFSNKRAQSKSEKYSRCNEYNYMISTGYTHVITVFCVQYTVEHKQT